MPLNGVHGDAAIIDLSGNLADAFPERVVLEVGRLVHGNPQKMLFLGWLQPESETRLRELAKNLEGAGGGIDIENFIDAMKIPGLFLLALGVHKNLIVAEQLLARLWDHFGSGGTDACAGPGAFVQKKILLPVGDDAFRLHESVHVRLEKALTHRVGTTGIPYFHQRFAEFYEVPSGTRSPRQPDELHPPQPCGQGLCVGVEDLRARRTRP